VARQEAAQRVGQVFAQRRRIAHQPHRTLQALRVLAEFRAHALQLLEHQARMPHQGLAGLCRRHPAATAQQQRHAQAVFHAVDAFARGSQRQVGTRGAAGDAAGFHHVQEELQVDQVESHRCFRCAFGLSEGWLRESLILEVSAMMQNLRHGHLIFYLTRAGTRA
jgi:hypothetical protein